MSIERKSCWTVRVINECYAYSFFPIHGIIIAFGINFYNSTIRLYRLITYVGCDK